MKRVIAGLFLGAILCGCATTAPLNQELVTKNVALVKDSVFVPGVSPTSSTLIAIDDKQTKFLSSSNEVPAGNRTLDVNCTYYVASVRQLYGRNVIKVNLEAGHTYKLILALRSSSCESIIEDQTVSN